MFMSSIDDYPMSNSKHDEHFLGSISDHQDKWLQEKNSTTSYNSEN